jgi:hypothetical protein
MVSKRRELVEKWFAGYKDWTPEACAAYRSSDCAHVVVGVRAPAPWTPEDTTSFFRQWEGISKTATFEVLDWLEDEAENKASLWVSLTQHFHDDLELKPYYGEYAMIFFFNKDQTAFTRFIEFVDNENTADILEKVNLGRQKRGKGPLEYPAGSAVCDTEY